MERPDQSDAIIFSYLNYNCQYSNTNLKGGQKLDKFLWKYILLKIMTTCYKKNSKDEKLHIIIIKVILARSERIIIKIIKQVKINKGCVLLNKELFQANFERLGHNQSILLFMKWKSFNVITPGHIK